MNRRSEVELTNMCFVYNDTEILVQEKIGTNREGGLVFPGGHIKRGESFRDSIIQEVKEETGLQISNPQPCGYKDWIQEDGTRYIVLLYKTNQYTGDFRSSEEGKVFWLDRKDIQEANFIWNMRELLRIFETDDYSEFFFKAGVGVRPTQDNLLG